MVFFKVSLSTIWLIKIDIIFLRNDAITNNISITKMSQFEPKISLLWFIVIIYAEFVCATYTLLTNIP